MPSTKQIVTIAVIVLAVLAGRKYLPASIKQYVA